LQALDLVKQSILISAHFFHACSKSQENVENFSGGVSSGVREGYSNSIGSGYSTGRLPQSTVNNQRFSAVEPIDNQEENQNMAAPNVDDIRKRLAKIKAQAF